MAGIQTITAASTDPIDIKDLKNFLKLDEAEDELYVRTLIGAATEYVESYTERSLINRTLKLSLDYLSEIDVPLWEGVKNGPDITIRKTIITLPKSPVSSVTSIYTYDDSDTATEFPSSKYYVDTASFPARVILRSGETWPTGLRVGNAVEITYVAGYGTSPRQVPEQIRLAIMQYAAFMYEHRGEFERFPPPAMPASLDVLLQSFRSMAFSTNSLSTQDRIY
jgi:hypothetical protein